jgi:hypothetical protein
VAFIVLAALVYLVVIALYASSGRAAKYGYTNVTPKPGHVSVVITARAVSAAGEHISADLQLVPSDKYISDDDITFDRTISVIISPVDGEQSLEFPKGTIPSSRDINITANGTYEDWPFDRYTTDPSMIVLAYTTDAAGEKVAIPTDVHIVGYVSGWNIVATKDTKTEYTVEDPDGEKQKVPTIDMVAWRNGSTLAFGVVLLALLIVMPTLVMIVAVTAYRGRRKVEASFMSWMGAMLFATIPLRTFLPGSPPIGSWIDFLIVLWVIVALVTGLAIYVAAWLRWGARGERAKQPVAVGEDVEPASEKPPPRE